MFEPRENFKTITIGFLSKPQSGVINKFTDWYMSVKGETSYHHVELMFSNNNVTGITRIGKTVHYYDKSFGNPQYTRFFKVKVTGKVETKMIRFARKKCKEKIPLGQMKMYWNFSPCGTCITLPRSNESYFCSEYITELLQIAGFFPEFNPETTSPTMLAAAMRNNNQFGPGVNEKQMKDN